MNQRMRTLAAAVGLITLGFSIGIHVDRRWLVGHTAAVETSDRVRGRLMEDLRATVGLSDDQVADVHRIMNRYQLTVTSAWDELHPQLEAVLDSAFAQVNLILDPSQVAAFHEWFARTHPRDALLVP